MKIKLLYTAMIGGTILFTSCDKWIDSEINIDPNNPAEVSIGNLLASAEVAYAYIQGGDIGRYNSLFTQHHAGVERQHAGIDTYGFTESDVNNSYETIYASVMQDLDVMINKASDPDNPSPHFRGIARTLLAMAIMQTTDLYNDMPFSDAFGGSDNLSAAYDTQEQIYDAVQDLLSGAIADFGEDPETFPPGPEDLIYGGDIGAWTALARTLSARAYVHLGIRDPGNYSNALDMIDAGAISDNSGDAQVSFQSGANENPWFQFMDQRGDIRMGEFFIDLMNNEGDPRIDVFSDTIDGGIHVGSPAGSPNLGASLPDFYAQETQFVPLATYVETKFLEAEAAFQDGDADRAASAHNDAVLASLEKFGVSDAAFELLHANHTALTITLEEIMTQKYVAMYTHPETFSDWRRTGIPDLQPAANAQGNGQIPTRWPYPQNERLYNENFPGAATINEKVWWDN